MRRNSPRGNRHMARQANKSTEHASIQAELLQQNEARKREIERLERKIISLEETLHVFESVLELSRKELQDKNDLIFAMEKAGELSAQERDSLNQTIEAYKQVAAMSADELNSANQVIEAHEQIERLSWEERRSMDHELLLAQKIQLGLMSRNAPSIAGLEVATRYLPTQKLGGDLYSLGSAGEDVLSVLICDVAGHGTQAALITMIVKTLADNLSQEYEEPGELLFHINNKLYTMIKDLHTFVTAAVLMVDVPQGEIRYANGGHPGLLFRNGDGEVEELQAHGSILGAFPDLKYTSHSHVLRSGDLLLLFTDGLLEANNQAQEMYGGTRLWKLLESLALDANAPDVLSAVLDDLDAFCGNIRKDDDVSLVVIRHSGT